MGVTRDPVRWNPVEVFRNGKKREEKYVTLS
jgi:hypothetical protein